MNSQKSLRDLTNNPDDWNKEDLNDVNQLIQSVNLLKKSVEPYVIDKSVIIKSKDISLKYYREYSIMTSIIECFIEKNEFDYRYLTQSLYNNISNNLYFNLTVSDIKYSIKRLITLGYVEVKIIEEDTHNPIFKITDIGIDHFRQQTLQNLASASFFNYHTYNLSKRSEKMNILMIIIAIASLVVAICAIYVSIVAK
ncbi:hypothetical protein PGH12_01330 [Chryseobacterium wangxinyae]|uniref:hypothetical protein n=1 Tax=Chryseobacterium sp. CY350 TaxID=2997336 RepID=UPI00226EC429|nr:hypothetical protein [Chryseobacterium sp. CY350]MCY0977177.1 hypothetical protein [Chryseobacterium sp. CY350]WBZ95802.1 hypothetical protein PGH12_01330 [Chryseobacterium sp. CY350]